MTSAMLAGGRLRDGLPVARGGLPLIGHLPSLYRGLPDLLRRAQREHGPVFWIRFASMWTLVCTGAGSVELLRHPAFVSSHLQEIAPIVAGKSLLAHDGAVHRAMRSALSGPFLPRGLAQHEVGETSRELLDALCRRWARAGRARPLPDAQEVALEIVFRALGVEIDELPEWRRQYRRLLLANLGIRARFPGSPASRAAKAKAWIDARFLARVVATRRDAPEGAPGRRTLLETLANARDEEGRLLDPPELVDNLRLLVLGGHETIASTLAWITVELGRHPQVWRRLCEEAGGAGEVPATLAAARELPFAEAVFRETVRVHPPFSAITRLATQATEHQGRLIPAGAMIGVDLWGASHDPAIFTDPDTFRPARWEGRDGPPSGAEIAQFGAGPHFCLGYHLAWLEAVQFATALARAAGEGGRGLRVRGPEPRPIFLPTEHPPPSTVVEIVR